MSMLQTLRNTSLLGLLLCVLGADAQAQWASRSGAGCARARYGVPAYRGLPAQGYQGYRAGAYGSGSVTSVRLGGALGQGPGIRVQSTRVRVPSQGAQGAQGVWVPAREVWVQVDGILQRRVVGGYYAQQGALRRADLGGTRYASRSSTQVRIRL
ncbi:MAG: hypothetical protein ACI8QZ_003489 [Chlamydiales bacterium]|jgi:hypothetical protein